MICARDRQRDRFSGTFCLGQFASFLNFVCFAGNHQLAGTIQIRQHNAGFGENHASQYLVKSDDRRHAAFGDVAGFLHEFSALPHQA